MTTFATRHERSRAGAWGVWLTNKSSSPPPRWWVSVATRQWIARTTGWRVPMTRWGFRAVFTLIRTRPDNEGPTRSVELGVFGWGAASVIVATGRGEARDTGDDPRRVLRLGADRYVLVQSTPGMRGMECKLSARRPGWGPWAWAYEHPLTPDPGPDVDGV